MSSADSSLSKPQPNKAVNSSPTFSKGHRRVESGSGLDDTDIDPERDVGVAVEVKDGSFAWNCESKEAILKGVNFKAQAG